MQNLLNLKVQTGNTYVPLKNFASITPAPKSGEVIKYNGTQSITIEADVSQGILPDDKIKEINEYIRTIDMKQTEISFGGEAEEQKAAMTFLGGAFVAAIFLMFLILLMQFNSFAQSLIVMSAIVFSISGVLLGLLITGRPFGIVMSGLAIIALAGIVVNNNIILIDEFNEFLKKGNDEPQHSSGYSRLRPVLLTSITTVLGLVNGAWNEYKFHNTNCAIWMPSTQWWMSYQPQL